MLKKSKILSLILIMTMLITSLTGCGKKMKQIPVGKIRR